MGKPSATTYYNKGLFIPARDIPSLSGKTAIVTGGNTGLGYQTCLELYKKGCHVFMASRSKQRATEAIEKLVKECENNTTNGKIEFLELDLMDLNQSKSAANDFISKNLPLHILVNNAGIMAPPFTLSKDGIESQFATNHLGHFVFTQTLLPTIISSAPSRIVNVSSYAHNYAPKCGIDFDNLNNEKKLNEWSRYGVSKLANILYTKELATRVPENVYVNTCHPGVVETELMRGPAQSSPWLKPFFWLFKFLTIKSPEGALTQLYLATSKEVEEKGIRGKYFVPFGKEADEACSEKALDRELGKRLWEFSEKVVGEKVVGK